MLSLLDISPNTLGEFPYYKMACFLGVHETRDNNYQVLVPYYYWLKYWPGPSVDYHCEDMLCHRSAQIVYWKLALP